MTLQRKQIQQAIQAEQEWRRKRRVWIAQQRHEWIERRRARLLGELDWIEAQRRGPDPQDEWLKEQHDSVQQQLADLDQQQRWLADRQHWLRAYQERIAWLQQQHQRWFSEAQSS